MNRTSDFWPSGIYDNRATLRREIWQDGRLCRYARRECVGSPVSVWAEVHAPWGEYPDYPANTAMEIAA